VTLFSIIIAIILFGLTGILEGKELSALLGSIAGYILGKAKLSGEGNHGSPGAAAGPAVAPANIPAPVSKAPAPTSETSHPVVDKPADGEVSELEPDHGDVALPGPSNPGGS
jgi:hypothetical protein